MKAAPKGAERKIEFIKTENKIDESSFEKTILDLIYIAMVENRENNNLSTHNDD